MHFVDRTQRERWRWNSKHPRPSHDSARCKYTNDTPLITFANGLILFSLVSYVFKAHRQEDNYYCMYLRRVRL